MFPDIFLFTNKANSSFLNETPASKKECGWGVTFLSNYQSNLSCWQVSNYLGGVGTSQSQSMDPLVEVAPVSVSPSD